MILRLTADASRWRNMLGGLLATALIAAGCTTTAGGQVRQSPIESATTASSSATTSVPSVTPDVVPEPIDFLVMCDYSDESGFERETYDFYWDKTKDFDLSSCENADPTGEEYTALQKRAVKVAGYDTVEEVGILYGLCAEVEGDYAKTGNKLSEGQALEAKGMLVICPNFPKAGTVRANIGQGDRAGTERKQGTRFEDGSYRVGKEIKPGRYFVPHGNDCYWERLDRRGNILANNFVHADTRVEVTIRSSDYTFSSENCGEWSRA